MLPNVVGKQVVLLVLEVENAHLLGRVMLLIICNLVFKNVVDDRRIIQETVNVSANTVVLNDNLLGSGTFSLMYLIAVAFLSLEKKLHLLCGLFLGHGGCHFQKTKTWHFRYISFYGVRVGNGLAEHLETTANADYRRAFAMSTKNGLC